MEEADGDGLDARVPQEADLAADGILVERRDDLAVRRGHALSDDAVLFWSGDEEDELDRRSEVIIME